MSAEASTAAKGDSSEAIASTESTAQRKSRHLLLQIETMYKVVLKLEDLKNPTAIEAAQILKEKRERERKLAAEQSLLLQQQEGNAATTITATATAAAMQPLSGRLNLQVTDPMAVQTEPTLDELVTGLVHGLTLDKVSAMMTVRKGKTLLRRALPHLVAHHMQHVWRMWAAILSTVPLALKKDREDAEGHLFRMYEVLKAHLERATFEHIVALSRAISGTNNKACSYFLSSKVSCLQRWLIAILHE